MSCVERTEGSTIWGQLFKLNFCLNLFINSYLVPSPEIFHLVWHSTCLLSLANDAECHFYIYIFWFCYFQPNEFELYWYCILATTWFPFYWDYKLSEIRVGCINTSTIFAPPCKEYFNDILLCLFVCGMGLETYPLASIAVDIL